MALGYALIPCVVGAKSLIKFRRLLKLFVKLLKRLENSRVDFGSFRFVFGNIKNLSEVLGKHSNCVGVFS